MLSKFTKRLLKNILFLQINCSIHKNGFLHFYLLPLLLLCPFDSNSSLQLHKLLPKVFLCSVCHCILVLPYCTVPAFSPPPLLISHCQKSWSRSMMCTLAWYGRRILAAVRLFCRSCTQAGMFFRVPLPPPTAVWPPHRK